MGKPRNFALRETFCQLPPQNTGNWLSRIWELYIDDPTPTPIEMLDNLVRLMFGKESAREGAGLTDFGILVIETDGSITKNDTLKFSFNGADRFTETLVGSPQLDYGGGEFRRVQAVSCWPKDY